jgi:hypothetical protein
LIKKIAASTLLAALLAGCSGGGAPKSLGPTVGQQNKARLLNAVAREAAMTQDQKIAAGVARGANVYQISVVEVIDAASHKVAVFPASATVQKSSSGVAVTYAGKTTQFSASAQITSAKPGPLLFVPAGQPGASVGDLPTLLAQSTSRSLATAGQPCGVDSTDCTGGGGGQQQFCYSTAGIGSAFSLDPAGGGGLFANLQFNFPGSGMYHMSTRVTTTNASGGVTYDSGDQPYQPFGPGTDSSIGGGGTGSYGATIPSGTDTGGGVEITVTLTSNDDGSVSTGAGFDWPAGPDDC